MANNGNRPSFEEVYGAYKASNRPSFEEVYGSYQASRNNTQQHSVSNAYASYGVNSTSQTAIEDYQKRLEGYDWIGEGDYYYDAFSETDQARKAAGEIPEHLYKKYDFDDPDDVVLYGLGLPPKSIIRTIADKADKTKEKAEKEAEDKAEETAYEQYRAQIDAAKDRSVFKGVNIPAAVKELTKGKTPTVQSETTPVSAQDAVFGDVPYTPDKKIEPLTPINKAENGWFGGIGDAITELRNTKAEDMAEKVAATYEQSARNDARFVDLEKALDTSEYDAYMRGELDELSPEGLAAHDIKEQIQGYKRNPGKGKDLSFVTDDEWAVYAHLYKTDSILTAQKYLDSIYARAAQRSAEDELQRFKGGIVDKVIQTLSAGFDNAIKGAQRLVSTDFVTQTDAPTVQAYQQARSEEEGVAALVSDALFAIGNMTPSMITGGLAGTTAGAVAMGASAAGNAYNTEIKNGKTHEQAMLYGALVGVAESLTSKFLGGVEGISKNLLGKLGYKGASNLLGKVIKNPAVVGAISNVLGRVASAASEGAEEYLQDAIIDPILRNIALDEENTINLSDENAWNSFLVGAITGGLLGGSGTVAENATTIDTPTAETPAQAQNETPEEAAQTAETPAPVSVGDTVTLRDGTTATVQGVSHDPFNNVDMYIVERNGQTEILREWEAQERKNTQMAENEADFEGFVETAWSGKTNENKTFKLSQVSSRAAEAIKSVYGVDIEGYFSQITSNDIRHIRNSHGIGRASYVWKNGRYDPYGITIGDIQAIPYILENFNDVYYVENESGKKGVVFKVDGVDDTYYLEAVIKGKALTGKQMIKVPRGHEAPTIEGLDEAIRKKEASPALDASSSAQATDNYPEIYAHDVWNNASDASIPDATAENNTQSELETAIAEYNAEEEAMERLEREGREMEQWISEGYSEKTAREIMENADGATLPVVLAQEETGSALLPAEQANKLADSVTELSARGVRPTKTLDQNLDYAAHNNRELRNVLHDVFVKDWREAQRREATNRVQKVDGYLKEAERIGIERGSLEEQATMWYGQGYKSVQNETGDWVPQPYGIRDLMKDCPDTWKKVVEFDRVNRELYDQYARELTELYKRIYPNVEERASRQLESAAARSQQREADYEAAQNRVRELETQLMEAETALSNKGRTDTKAFETVQNRVNRLERQLTEAQQNMLRRKELADEANVLLMNLDHAVKDGSFFQGKRFFPRANYYAHMMSDSDNGVIEAINELRTGGKGISPQLAGKSEFTKPKSRFAGFTQRRTGVYSELGTIDAMLKYIDIAEYKLAYDPVVAKAREAAEVIRQSAAMSPGVEEKPTIQNLEPLLDYLDQWANKLAGKTVREDRTLMGYVNRAGLKLAKAINSRVKANAIVGNAMSAVAQVCNIPVAASFVSNPADWVGGATLMVRAHHGNGGEAKAAFDNSPIMQQRYLDRRMRQVNPEGSSALQKLTNAMLEGGDLVSSELMWYSAYNMYNRLDGDVGSKFTRDYENAADFADDVVQRSVAARGAGDIPLTQQSELIKLLAPLQIEVNNQWQTLKSQLSKKTTGSRNIKSIVAMSVATYLLNELLELATGDRKAGFDFVQTFADMYELFTDDEGTVSSDVADAAGRLGGEVLSGVPGGAYFGMLLTGGDDATAEKLFGESDPTRYGVGNMGLSAWADPIISLIQGGTVDPLAAASNIVLPYGGKQVKRMVETAQNQGWIPDVQFSTGEGFTVRQAETPTSYSSAGRVRFAAEDDPLSILQSMLFGQYSTTAGRAYISGGTKLLSEKNSETYNALAAAGMDGKDIMEQLNTLAGFKTIKEENYEISAADQKREHIEDSDLTIRQQMILMGSIDSNFTKNARAAKELGISNEQFLEYEYARVRIEVELQEYKRDHDGKTPKGGKGKMLMDWLRTQNLTDPQAIYLYELHNDGGTGVPGTWKGWD